MREARDMVSDETVILEKMKKDAAEQGLAFSDMKTSAICTDAKGKQWHSLEQSDGSLHLYPVLITVEEENFLRALEDDAVAAVARQLPIPLVIVSDRGNFPPPLRKRARD